MLAYQIITEWLGGGEGGGKGYYGEMVRHAICASVVLITNEIPRWEQSYSKHWFNFLRVERAITVPGTQLAKLPDTKLKM